MEWSGVDLVEASALATALFGALLLVTLTSQARDDVLGSPIGGRLVAAALALFAGRGFLRFFRLDGSGWLRHPAHDGRLDMRDNDDGGTTLEIELPRLANQTTTPKGPSAAAEGGVQAT